jgi:hypothetical protein
VTDPAETIDELAAELDALRAELAAAQALNKEWEQKAATWLATPEAAARLQGYLELGQRAAKAQNDSDALRAELAAASRQHSEATAWRPIDTAPMNGTRVMLYGDGRVTMGSWITEREVMASTYHHTTGAYLGCFPNGDIEPAYWESHDGGFTEEHPPTHWMPLPQPPRNAEGGGA